MSLQLVKLKSALVHSSLPSVAATAATSFSSASSASSSSHSRFHHPQSSHLASSSRTHVVSNAPSSSTTMRFLSTQTPKQMKTIAPAAASSSSATASASSSSSHKSSSSRFSSLFFGLTVGGLFGAVALSTMGEAQAEAAAPSPSSAALTDSLSLPDVDISAPVATQVKKAKKGGKKGKASKRKKLDYPGKLDKLHRQAESIVQIHVSPGVRCTIPIGAWHIHPHIAPDKMVNVFPVFELGGPNGPSAQLHAQTHLGQSHFLMAMMDTQFNSNGTYKYSSERGFSVKGNFSMHVNGSGFSIEGDQKGREHAINASINPLNGEAEVSYNKALTPTLIGGVQLHHVLMTQSEVNGGVKYTFPTDHAILAASKQHSRLIASYWQKLYELSHPQGPTLAMTEAGLVNSFDMNSQKSDILVAIKHTKPSYTYQLGFTSSEPALQMAFESVLGEINPNWKWGINAQANFDGSGQSGIGLSLSIGL